MAFANDTTRTAAGPSLWDRVTEIGTELADRWAKYATYRATLSELASLSDRDLTDLGLHRSMIADGAREAVYKA